MHHTGAFCSLPALLINLLASIGIRWLYHKRICDIGNEHELRIENELREGWQWHPFLSPEAVLDVLEQDEVGGIKKIEWTARPRSVSSIGTERGHAQV